MRNALLFADGAVQSAVWTAGPLLLRSLLLRDGGGGGGGHLGPPSGPPERAIPYELRSDLRGPKCPGGGGVPEAKCRAAADGLGLEYASYQASEWSYAPCGCFLFSLPDGRVKLDYDRGSLGCKTNSSTIGMICEKQYEYANESVALSSTMSSMICVLLTFMIGRALGRYLVDRRRGCPRLVLAIRRVLPRLRNVASWRAACSAISAVAALLLLNWGLGVRTFAGWAAVRFVTAAVSGGVMTWGERNNLTEGNNDPIDKEEDGADGEKQHLLMEEGRALKPANESIASASELMLWWNSYWLAGVATSSLLGGSMLRPLSRFNAAFYPHDRICALVVVTGLGGLIDRCLHRYYSKDDRRRVGALGKPTSASLDGCTAQTPSHDRHRNNSAIRRSSSTARRKQVQQRSPRHSTAIDEEQQLSFYDRQTMESPQQRHRLNSNDTLESEQFFDCLDDIELDAEHDVESGAAAMQHPAAPAAVQSYDEQIAIYSGRRVTYPDGTPSYVPAGETASTVPSGYLALYKNDRSKSLAMYRSTQEWRRKEQIHSIHARPHTWFAEIKKAYPHVVHGFTPDGMPVVYESPGRMNLKHLFRNGCHVDDMVNHYCYLMEYLSNLESVLTELHSSGDDEDSAWQDELASYAHAKQGRLQSDSVPFGFCVVMDISGASPTSLSGDVMIYLKRAGDVNSEHYPGSMRRAIAVQAPFWIGVAWKAIKGVLPASVTVDLLSGTQTMEGGLKQHIDEDQIPVEYGGKSKFKLGEHPFELGLRKLVERQGEVPHSSGLGYEDRDLDFSQADSPLLKPASSCTAPSTPLVKDATPEWECPASPAELSTASREWDGLSHESILAVVSVLRFFVFAVVGSLELALPYWVISPPLRGHESSRNGVAVFVSCLITWCGRTRLIRSIVKQSPLRGVRLGTSTSCLALVCLSLVPLPSNSTISLVCFSMSLSLLFTGIGLGILSLDHLTSVAITDDSMLVQSSKAASAVQVVGRVVGYILIMPIFKWSVGNGFSFPLNPSFFLLLLACVCWLLYILSFALHTTSQKEKNHRKESQLMSVVSSCIAFIKEVFLVARSDANILLARPR